MSCNYLRSNFNLPINISQKLPCRDMFAGQLLNGNYIANIQRYQSPDLYAIEYCRNSVGYDLNNIKRFNNNIIVCVLESPHRDEYLKSNNFNCGYSAMGRTGKFFDKKFKDKLLENHTNFCSGNYDIVLLNSVQFQCSNAHRPLKKTIRDTNWNAMINNNDIYDELLHRIQALNPAYIINLCTKSHINLQLILQSKLIRSNVFNICNHTHGWHPSTWNNSKSSIY